MKEIIQYLTDTYHPAAIIQYGSFASGTNNADSDYDVLLICESCQHQHDASVIDGVQLDAVIQTREQVLDAQAIDAYVTVYDGKILLDDAQHTAQTLIARVRAYVQAHAARDEDEKAHLRQWCRKMLARARHNDAEGLYRAHWLLTDSLEIYCVMRDQYYFGPKKTIRAMQAQDAQGYALLEAALLDLRNLKKWTEYALQSKGQL